MCYKYVTNTKYGLLTFPTLKDAKKLTNDNSIYVKTEHGQAQWMHYRPDYGNRRKWRAVRLADA
jgi:hypothetical protein